MNPKIKAIVAKLDEAEQIKANAQAELREFVTGDAPISERYEIWRKYCTKETHGWVIHEADVPVIGKYVDEKPDYFDRYAEYDYDYFFDCLRDKLPYELDDDGMDADAEEQELDEDQQWLADQGISSEDDIKELLIEENFGSFTYDW